MGRALDRSAVSSLLKTHPSLTWKDGKYSYKIAQEGEIGMYTVTDGTETISLPMHWIFGADSQTFVLKYGERFYESRVSYYDKINGLDVTVGDQQLQPRNIVEAMGREISDQEAKSCFQCHATGAVVREKLELTSLTPGVQCAHCHTGTEAHLQSVTHGKLENVPPKLKTMTSEDTANFCGQCHRSFSDVVRGRLFGQMNVRFQPYRLASSKCFDGSDRRISCTSCHDPHVDLARDDKAYESKCLACHATSAKTVAAKVGAKPCPVARTGCVSCHMPKVQLPGGHQVFTDHFIRVVKAGEAYPD